MTPRISKLALLIVVLIAVVAGYLLWNRQYAPEARIYNKVRMALTDPESAQFRNFRTNASTGVSCGEVNAKNKLGGYVGFKKFLASADGSVVLEPPIPTIDEKTSEFIQQIELGTNFVFTYAKNCPDK